MATTLSRGEKVFIAFVTAGLVLIGFVSIFPFLHVIARSLSGESAITRGEVVLWPINFTVEAYERVFKLRSLIISFGNTIFIATVGTTIQMVLSICVAYPLSRKRLPFRSFFTIFVVFTMLFPVGIIPFYLLVRSMRLLNTLWSLIIPFGITTFNMIIVKNFFQSIPDELEEATLMDGANDLQILFSVFIPLSVPVIATITLFYMVQNWNVFIWAVFFINDGNKWPIQVTLQGMLFADLLSGMVGSAPAEDELARRIGFEGMKAATTIATVIPVLIAYPFIQRFFVKGIMLGSIKG